jgi:hypothetical protein
VAIGNGTKYVNNLLVLIAAVAGKSRRSHHLRAEPSHFLVKIIV